MDLDGARCATCCCVSPTGDAAAAVALRRAVELLAERVGLRGEEERLLEELSASWENIEALYEFSALAPASNGMAALIERILDRVAEVECNTRVALWNDHEGRPFDSRLVHQVRALALQAVLTVEADWLNRASVENELIRQELEIGSQVQQTLLFGNQPSAFPHARVATLAVASQKVGGDFFEFFQQSPTCLAILIGDVMGKGLKAALLGAAVSRQFHRPPPGRGLPRAHAPRAGYPVSRPRRHTPRDDRARPAECDSPAVSRNRHGHAPARPHQVMTVGLPGRHARWGNGW